jgi:hypothetical protein
MAHFWVNGIVSSRDKQPYIQLSNEKGMITLRAALAFSATVSGLSGFGSVAARAGVALVIERQVDSPFFACTHWP